MKLFHEGTLLLRMGIHILQKVFGNGTLSTISEGLPHTSGHRLSDTSDFYSMALVAIISAYDGDFSRSISYIKCGTSG